MKIADIQLGMLRVPLKTPFKTALRTVETIEDVVVLVHTDSGHIGYGEAPATAPITGDTHGSIVEAIERFIKPRLLGADVADLNRLTGLIQGALQHNSSAKAAVEIAAYDLWAQLYGAPLYRMLGGGTPAISTDITISVDAIDKMVADALSALARGFAALKIKVGNASTWTSNVSRRSRPRSQAALRCAWTPTRAGPRGRRCTRCARWKRPGWSWNCWSNRSRPGTSTA